MPKRNAKTQPALILMYGKEGENLRAGINSSWDEKPAAFLQAKKEAKLRAWPFKMVAMTGLEPVTPAL